MKLEGRKKNEGNQTEIKEDKEALGESEKQKDRQRQESHKRSKDKTQIMKKKRENLTKKVPNGGKLDLKL